MRVIISTQATGEALARHTAFPKIQSRGDRREFGTANARNKELVSSRDKQGYRKGSHSSDMAKLRAQKAAQYDVLGEWTGQGKFDLTLDEIRKGNWCQRCASYSPRPCFARLSS